MPRGPSQKNNHDGRLTLKPFSRINAYNCNPRSHVNHTGHRNGFLAHHTHYACTIITVRGHDIVRYTILIITTHTWIGPSRFFIYFSFHGPYCVQAFEDGHTNRLTSGLSYELLYYNSRANKFWIALSIPSAGFDVYLIHKPKYINPCGNSYRPHTGLVPIISRPIFSTIPANPKPLTHYLLYFFIHYLTGPYATLASSDPADPGSLESHTYYGAVYSGNVVKPAYYISGILSFYLIDSGTLT